MHTERCLDLPTPQGLNEIQAYKPQYTLHYGTGTPVHSLSWSRLKPKYCPNQPQRECSDPCPKQLGNATANTKGGATFFRNLQLLFGNHAVLSYFSFWHRKMSGSKNDTVGSTCEFGCVSRDYGRELLQKSTSHTPPIPPGLLRDVFCMLGPRNPLLQTEYERAQN